MERIKKTLIQLVSAFRQLKTSTKILVAAAILFGCIIRYVNLFHPGYEFDTVTTQYEWGLNADKMGFVGFWRDYAGFLDYLPGAVYILGVLHWISSHFGDNAQAFVVALKSMNWIADIGFAAILVYIAKRYGKFTNHGALLLASFVYIIPSIWFVSVVWGQFDTLLVLFTLVSVLLLYRGVESKDQEKPFYKDLVFWSGFVLALGFWFKLQTALVLPVLILFHLSYRNIVWIERQVAGWTLGTFLLLVVPFFVHPLRLVVNALQPFVRGDEITKGASTFWPLLGITGSGSDKVFDFNGFGLSVSLTGLLLFAGLMLLLVIRYFKVDLRKLPDIAKLLPNKLSFLDFALIMTISSSLYFMLFTKMHSRYLHIGLLFAFVSFAAMGITSESKKWFWFVVILNFSYFLNQVGVYVAVREVNPIWVSDFYNSFNLSVLQLGSLLNFVCILGMYIWVWRNKSQKNKS
jgi:hypothetical protein